MAATCCGVEQLGLQPGQYPQRLGVALEPTTVHGELVQSLLTVVSEGRVADVMSQSRGLHHVRVTTQLGGDPTTDLGDLQRVGQPGPGHVPLPRTDHLGLAREPAQRRGVQHPGTIPDEGAATLRPG